MKRNSYRSSAYFQHATRSHEEATQKREAREERNRVATRERLAQEREAYMRAGLTSHGEKFTDYATWKMARTVAAKAGKRWRVDVLDKAYPAFFAQLDQETSLEGSAQRERERREDASRRNVRYQRRKAQYRREDIATGDMQLSSYRQFVAEMDRARRGSPHQNSDLAAALRSGYPEWYRKYLDTRRIGKYKMRKAKNG